MANWDDIAASGNVEDRRGRSGLLLGGGSGLIGIVLFLALNFMGIQVDPGTINSVLDTIGTTTQSSEQSPEFQGEDDYERFAKRVLGSSNAYWSRAFQGHDTPYTEPRLVLYRGATQTACGTGSSQVGPFYCPADQTIYLDETFFDTMKQLGGSSSDVAQAYVIAHESGHHAQYLLGIMDQVMRDPNYQRAGQNSLAVRLELQADCFAGLWANSLRDQNIFGPNEINDAITMAGAVGDDRIQESMQGNINPETWTHGSSEDRMNAFTRGYDSGQLSTCSL